MSQSLYSIDEHLMMLLSAREDLAEENADVALITQCEAEIRVYTEKQLAKVDGIAAVLMQLWDWRETRKREAQRFAALSKAAEEDYTRLERYVLDLMREGGRKTLESARHKLTAHGNGGVAPLEILQPNLVPLELHSVTLRVDADHAKDICEQFLGHVEVIGKPEPDRRRIRERLEAGEVVLGCIISERGQHLMIK
jgi:hypothetical protein